MPTQANLHEQVLRAAEGHLRTVANRVATRAAQLAPVDTGHLRASIHVAPGPAGEGFDVVVDADYWAPVEFGHRLVAWGYDTGRYVPAQPFMRPALGGYAP